MGDNSVRNLPHHVTASFNPHSVTKCWTRMKIIPPHSNKNYSTRHTQYWRSRNGRYIPWYLRFTLVQETCIILVHQVVWSIFGSSQITKIKGYTVTRLCTYLIQKSTSFWCVHIRSTWLRYFKKKKQVFRQNYIIYFQCINRVYNDLGKYNHHTNWTCAW